MKLTEIIADIQTQRANLSTYPEVEGISVDSRTTKPGDLFIAVQGANLDGDKFIPAAIKRGQAA